MTRISRKNNGVKQIWGGWIALVLVILTAFPLMFSILLSWQMLTLSNQSLNKIQDFITQHNKTDIAILKLQIENQIPPLQEQVSTIFSQAETLATILVVITFILALTFIFVFWSSIKLSRLNGEIVTLQERYNLLLGSKKIVDTELAVIKKRLQETSRQ